jgi:TPR repeat protein
MLRGVALDVPLALTLHGYHLFYGLYNTKIDRIKGRELILRAKEKNCERADIYLLMIDDSDIDPDVYVQKIVDYNSAAKSVNQVWYFLGNVYLNRLNDFDKAIEAYNKGIELNDDPYCKYKKAYAILNGDIDGDIDEALLMMAEAYEWHISDAADSLGRYYCYSEDYRDPEKAVEWYGKAILYGNSSAMLNLSLIYHYEDEKYKDAEKAFKYVNMAIMHGNIRALCVKADMLEFEDRIRNKDLVKALLDKAYEAKNGYAAYRLGCKYQDAEFSEKPDYETAFKYFLEGAEWNCLSAIEMAGHYCRIGLAGEPDCEKAFEYFHRAIERGSNYSRVELAVCYELGIGTEQNHDKAFELLKSAADANYTYAHLKLGYFYLNGLVGEPDLDKAFEHFSKAAADEDFEAMYNLGRMYKYAVGRPENPELALEYFEKAAEGGDADANIEMALSYEHEYGGLEFDAEEIVKYMTCAAESDHPYAQYKLGVYCYYGLVEQNVEKGLEYLQKSYESGSPHAAAVLGDHFLYCTDESGNAFQYYQYAAERDYITEGVGLCYQFGIGVESSDSEAFKYFSIAAGRNFSAAKYRLGICYKYEVGTAKNLSEAYKWMLQAAEENNRNAKYEIAMMLLDGDGVAMNLEKGVEWLRKAADDEHGDAQLELGNCYLTGRGVDEDEIQAMFWYQKAAENGNEHARKIIGKRNKQRR